MRRSLTFVLALALITAACSGTDEADPGAEAAALVMARVDEALGAQEAIDPDEIVVPEGCRIVVEVDEYDFETEIVVCDDEATTTTTTVPGAAGLAAWIGGDDAREIARRLGRVLVGQNACTGAGDLERVAELAPGVPEEIRGHLEAAIAHLGDSAAACETDREAWRNSLEAALDELAQLTELLEGAAGG